MEALVDGHRAIVAVRGAVDMPAVARDLVRRGAVTAVGLDARGGEPGQLRAALTGAERACLVAAAAGPPVRPAAGLGALGAVAGSVLAGERVEARFAEGDQELLEALVATGWSKAAAARRLRVSRQRLYERLAALNERHGVDVDLPQTRVELALEAWAVRMADLVD
jgi:hypothetical protein